MDPETEETTTIKCIRCPREFVAGEVATTHPMDRADVIAMVIRNLGWRKTFAGWQCPDHAP